MLKSNLKNFLFNLRSFDSIQNIFSVRKTTLNHKSSGLRLHLGAGNVDFSGWINIDARPLNHIHLVDLDLSLNKFSDHSVSAIYICHVLEHFSFQDVDKLIRKFVLKLEPNGTIFISVPDFHKINSLYSKTNDISCISSALLGGQDYEYNFHKSIFDFNSLYNLLNRYHFRDIEVWSPSDIFSHPPVDFSSHPLSLNIRAINTIVSN